MVPTTELEVSQNAIQLDRNDDGKVQPHPMAEVFPRLSITQIDAIAADMRNNGFDPLLPIVVHEGKILDGRARDRAARLAGVEPVYVQYKGNDALGYVVKSNAVRRQLTTKQRAEVAAKAVTFKVGDNGHSQGLSVDTAARMFGISASTIHRAKRRIVTGDVVPHPAPPLDGGVSPQQARRMAHVAARNSPKVDSNKSETVTFMKLWLAWCPLADFREKYRKASPEDRERLKTVMDEDANKESNADPQPPGAGGAGDAQIDQPAAEVADHEAPTAQEGEEVAS